MKKWLALLMAMILLAIPGMAEETILVDVETVTETSIAESLPFNLPIFETDTFTITKIDKNTSSEGYTYTFEGTGMDAETVLSMMAETSHVPLDFVTTPLTAREGTAHLAVYTYEGDQEITLIPPTYAGKLHSVYIMFSDYADGTCKMTLICSPELVYPDAE